MTGGRAEPVMDSLLAEAAATLRRKYDDHGGTVTTSVYYQTTPLAYSHSWLKRQANSLLNTTTGSFAQRHKQFIKNNLKI